MDHKLNLVAVLTQEFFVCRFSLVSRSCCVILWYCLLCRAVVLKWHTIDEVHRWIEHVYDAPCLSWNCPPRKAHLARFGIVGSLAWYGQKACTREMVEMV